MNKAIMKTFAIKARKKLIDEILDRIQMFSLDSKTELPNLLPKNPVKQECFLQLQRQIEENDVLSVAEQAACVWFHRLVSIWFMEVNEYLPTEPFFSRFSPNGFKRNDVDADLVLATDPDADRLGVRVKDKNGEYHDLTGNMSGCLLANYEISQRKAVNGSLPEDGALIKTIVTTNLADAIAKGYGVKLIEVLTGFKFIGQQILGFEKSGKGSYLFGFEESYGCLIGTYARDKDAIVATMALCEAAAYYKTQGKTLWDAMIEMYEQFGYYKDDIKAVTMKGIEGLQKIQDIMNSLRQNPPAEFAGHKVVAVRDYKADTIKNLETGEVTPTGLPNSNVLYYELTNDAWVCVRPSGTEPKVKFYYGVKGTSLADADEKSAVMGKAVLDMVDSMM